MEYNTQVISYLTALQKLQNEIRIARKLGVISYPSLLLEHNGCLFPVSVDYLDHETMIREIVSILIIHLLYRVSCSCRLISISGRLKPLISQHVNNSSCYVKCLKGKDRKNEPVRFYK